MKYSKAVSELPLDSKDFSVLNGLQFTEDEVDYLYAVKTVPGLFKDSVPYLSVQRKAPRASGYTELFGICLDGFPNIQEVINHVKMILDARKEDI